MAKANEYMAMMFGNMHDDLEEKSKERCDLLRDQYANLQNLPRKKKKQEKKRIIVEWNIFSYNPMTRDSYEWAK